MKRHPLYYLIQNSALMTSLAKNYGTPLYIYSEKRLLENLDRLNNALKTNFNKYHICYALKANSNPALIMKMKNHLTSLGADCSSPGELHAAKLGGIDHHECIYTGNYESQEDLQAAYNSGCHINLDDITSFHRLTKIGIPDEISFRLNPGFGKGTFSQIITAGENAKFGVPHYDIVNAYRTAKNAGVKRFGIQCMTGSGILDPDYFSVLMKNVLKNMNVIHQELGILMDYISLGGGFGIPYQDGETPLNFDQVFKKVGDVFRAHFKKDAKPSLWVEPGKSIVGDTGLVLTKVTGIKKSYKTFIGLDAGMETLMRPALYGAYHRIYKVGNPGAKSTNIVDITGRICENTDRLAVDRPFPEVSEGDLIAIMDTGAYGYAMAHQFNTRPRPAEVLINGDQSCLIRKRETIQDIFRTCDD